jgi:DNA-binding CsgD family transcriptional regulator
MSFIINPGQVVSFHKQPAGLFAQEVSQIIEPLRKSFGINYFGYSNLVGIGEEAFLTNHPESSEDYFNNQFYRIGFLADPKEYQSGYYLVDAVAPNPYTDLLKERYNLAHFLAIFRRQGAFCQRFFFGATADNENILNVYLNRLSLFDSFADYFTDRASDLIRRAELSKTQVSPDFCLETVLAQKLDCEPVFFPTDVSLTVKERECACYLSQCLSLKEVSERVGISPRTLEKHVAKLKYKLGCKNITSLVVELRKYFL